MANAGYDAVVDIDDEVRFAAPTSRNRSRNPS